VPPVPTGPGRARAAAAGAVAAFLWGVLEPLDERIFGSDYRNTALLGKLLVPGRGWQVAGLAAHTANGALFGLAFHAIRRRTSIEPRRLALGLALAENVLLYPLTVLVDAHHPRRGDPHLPPLGTKRVFAQETFRHAVFGIILGRLA
jgi:hypothetical protein